MGNHSGKKSRCGELFYSIHNPLSKSFKKKSDGDYVRRMYSWHPDLRNDIRDIVKAENFYDNYMGKVTSKSRFGSVRTDHMINATLAGAFLSGLRTFEKIDSDSGDLYCVTQKNCQDLFCCSRAVYYPDIVFSSYIEMKSAVDTLRSNLTKQLCESEEEISDKIDSILLGKISAPEKAVYSGIAEYFGMYGKLFFAAYYAVNGNAPVLPNHSFIDNIHLTERRNIESNEFYSLRNRLANAKTVRVVAFTATSLLGGNLVSDEVYDSEGFRLFKSLLEKGVHIDLVLSPPDRIDMSDIINYQLRPRKSSAGVNKLYPFTPNYKRLKRIMESIEEKEIEGSNLNVYFAPFSMTCSYFQTEFEDESMDSVKVDMYIPMFSRYEKDENGDIRLPAEAPADDCRPSFIIGRNHEMYPVFNRNIHDIVENSIPVILRSEYAGEGRGLIEAYASEDFVLPFAESDILPWLR